MFLIFEILYFLFGFLNHLKISVTQCERFDKHQKEDEGWRMEWLIWKCLLAGKMKYEDGRDRWRESVVVGLQLGSERGFPLCWVRR